MPSFSDMKRKYSNSLTVGQQLKRISDMAMQQTFDNDPAARQCYIYDYHHDDQKDSCFGYDPSLSTSKLPVKLKFIIKEYKSMSKDEPEYHIQFTPNDWNTQSCKPDYFSQYESYMIEFPIGMYIDIPDDRGVYHKWLIIYSEVANQFPKFGVMKCNHKFHWVNNTNGLLYRYQMWGVLRTQNSYNSGVYTYNQTTRPENQAKFILPWNNVSDKIKHDQRLLVSSVSSTPTAWKITKVENTFPKGVIFFTLYQDELDYQSDYMNERTGEMYADYYAQGSDHVESNKKIQTELLKTSNDRIILNCVDYHLKGDCPKVIPINFFDAQGSEVSGKYANVKLTWQYYFAYPGSDDVYDVTSYVRKYIKDIKEYKQYGYRYLTLTFIDDPLWYGALFRIKCTYKDLYTSVDLVFSSL